ncbi:MAG: hypothetical protein JWO62_2320 [Acidimicrobiaceae bacterium]|jgi:hypothetical protein|nr:hypothetical protein [Acidimicrobiaceae bacterium]
MALSIAEHATDVIADRAYSMARAETFRRPLHERGIDVVLDFSEKAREKVKMHRVERRSGEATC